MDLTSEMCARGVVEDERSFLHEPVKDRPPSPTANGNETGEVVTANSAAVNNHQMKLADPGPLGLIAFGITTILFNLTNAKLFAINTTTVGIVITYGGVTQMIVGIMEFVRGNTFGCTISMTFGAFWVATALVWILPQKNESTPHAELQPAEESFMGVFFFVWAIFLFAALVASLRQPLAIVLTFFTAFLFFFIQSIAFWTRSGVMKQVAGYDGILCGALALYCGIALTLNDAYNRTVLPLFPPFLRGSRW